MYNTVRGYCTAINELWAHQVSRGLHSASRPQKVAMTALKTSIARVSTSDAAMSSPTVGLATIRDGYTASRS